jgi:hypothetical protein
MNKTANKSFHRIGQKAGLPVNLAMDLEGDGYEITENNQ